MSRLQRAASIALAMAVLAPTAASAHDVKTPKGHASEDAVTHDAATEKRLTQQTAQRSAAESQAVESAVTGTEGEVGRWGPVADWPVVGVHVALLPNGKVLAFDSIGDKATESYPAHTTTRATVWDPATGTHTPVNVNTGHNIFCAGFAHLMDGSLFLAGGNKDPQLNGIRKTHLFDSSTYAWSLGPDMAADRWYPSVTPLNNGETLITEGGPDVPEVRRTDGTLRSLGSASLNLPLYPWMDVAPDGRTFYFGPDQTMRSLSTTGTGSWQTYGQRDSINRDYGSHANYDVGKILVAGGGASSRDSRVIDMNGSTPQASATGQMAFGRRQHNLTVLADGTVLGTGGNSTGASLVDMNGGVYPAELWNPATGAWKTLDAMAVTRQYHSTALLLPDGRVLSSGGGICGTCDDVGYLAKNAEIFSPPYLFKKDGTGQLAPRPEITAAPSSVSFGAPFQVSTPDPSSIRKLALVRLGSVTHSVDMEQRFIPLTYSAGSGVLNATGPANANVAPPGVYMLFAVDAAGVPSVAKMIRVEAPAAPAQNQPPQVSLTSPSDGASYVAPAKVQLAASAGDPDGTVTAVEFFDGSSSIGRVTSTPYSLRWNGAGPGTHRITARATDNRGATTTSAPVSITVTKKR